MKTINSWVLVSRQDGTPLITSKKKTIKGILKSRRLARRAANTINDMYGVKLYRVAKAKVEIDT